MAVRSSKRDSRDTATPTGLFERLEAWGGDNHDVIVTVALALIVFGVTVTRHALPSMVHDAYAYTMAAQRLIRDGFYAYGSGELPGTNLPLDARVTPGYILFLAAFYGLFGRSGDPLTAVTLVQPLVAGVQFLLALSAVGMLALCGRELGGRKLGLVTGIMAAVYLPFAWASTVALSEALVAPLLSAQLLWALRITRKDAERSVWSMLGFGAFSAVVVMVRPSLVLWVLVPLAYAILMRLESWKRLLRLAAVAALGFVLVFAPWWARNMRALDMFVPLRTDFVRTASGDLQSISSDPPAPATTAQRFKIVAAVATAPWAAPDDVLWENRFHYDELRVDFGRFPSSVHDALVPVIGLMRNYHMILLLAAAAGLLFARRSPRLLIVATMPVYAVAVHFTTLLNPRYAYLGMPALIVISAAGAFGVWKVLVHKLRSANH